MITNEKSTSEERALARIFSHKNLVTGIAAIKEKFQLDDSNDIWKRMIFEVGKKKKMKLKKSGKWVEPPAREKKSVQKMKNKPQMEREEWLKKNTEANEVDEEVVTNDVNIKINQKAEKVVLKNPKRKAPVKVEESECSNVSFINKETKENSDESEDGDESEKDERIKKLVFKKIKKEEIEIKEAIPDQTVDSFFITENGSNYMSSVVLNQNQDDEDINTNLPFHKKNVNKNQVHTPGINRRQRRQGITVPTFVPKPIEPPKKVVNEDVHPSWLAKQKQRSIQEFQGKKITFDDSGNNQPIPKKIVAAPTEPDKTLHPSWAAKLKQKPVMTEFKGSKIVFDD